MAVVRDTLGRLRSIHFWRVLKEQAVLLHIGRVNVKDLIESGVYSSSGYIQSNYICT